MERAVSTRRLSLGLRRDGRRKRSFTMGVIVTGAGLDERPESPAAVDDSLLAVREP